MHKHIIDVASITSVAAAFAGWLPNVALLLTIVWTLIRIVETDTFKKTFGKKTIKKDGQDG